MSNYYDGILYFVFVVTVTRNQRQHPKSQKTYTYIKFLQILHLYWTANNAAEVAI